MRVVYRDPHRTARQVCITLILFGYYGRIYLQRIRTPLRTYLRDGTLARVVTLDFEELEQLGVGPAAYGNRDYARTQEISDGVNYLGCDGLIVPSARYDGDNLVVYMQNLERDCFLEEVESRQFQWPDWTVIPTPSARS